MDFSVTQSISGRSGKVWEVQKSTEKLKPTYCSLSPRNGKDLIFFFFFLFSYSAPSFFLPHRNLNQPCHSVTPRGCTVVKCTRSGARLRGCDSQLCAPVAVRLWASYNNLHVSSPTNEYNNATYLLRFLRNYRNISKSRALRTYVPGT